MAGARDEAADDPAQAETEVHADPLERERRVCPLRRRQPREQRRLAGPKTRRPRAFEREQDEGVPRLADEGEQGERDRLEQQSQEQGVPPAETVDECPGPETGCERGNSARGEREARGRERDSAHVVQVDDDERKDDPVPERVDNAAGLDEPDLARQHRVEAADVARRRSHVGGLPERGRSDPPLMR